MNERIFCRSRAFGAILQCEFWLIVRGGAAVLLAITLVGTTGFARHERIQRSDLPAGSAVQPAPELNQLGRAKELQGQLIPGLDGALYEPYRSAIIERVQKALRDRGLYGGPMNGILDRPTMESIYAFQRANNLQRCGVPTPHTRKMLQQGSHTDLSF